MKNFTKEGNVYTLNKQYGLFVPLIGFFLLLTILGFVKIPESTFKWWMLGITTLLTLSFYVGFLTIDMDQQEFRTRVSLFSGVKVLPLSDLEGFTIHKLKQMGFITTNVTLLANYSKNGKNKELKLAQHFYTKPIQSILNEIHEIIER